MVLAAVRKIIDFRQAEIFDPVWANHSSVLLRGTSILEDRDFYVLFHQNLLSKLNISGISEDSFNKIQDTAGEIFNKALSTFRPWDYKPEAQEEREKREVGELRNMWQGRFGQMDDPETQRKLQLVADAFKRRLQEKPEGSSRETVFNAKTAAAMPVWSQEMNR